MFAGAESGSGASASSYVAITPQRILDTRTGTSPAPVGPAGSIDLKVLGVGGVPDNAIAVTLNVTATEASSRSWLRVYPKGAAMPVTSTLNWNPYSDVANEINVLPGTDGKITIYNLTGTVHVVVDVVGYTLPAGQRVWVRTVDATSQPPTLLSSGAPTSPATAAAIAPLAATVTVPTGRAYLVSVIGAGFNCAVLDGETRLFGDDAVERFFPWTGGSWTGMITDGDITLSCAGYDADTSLSVLEVGGFDMAVVSTTTTQPILSSPAAD